MKPAKLEFVTIGKVLAPSGIKGRVKVTVATDFPQRFAPSSAIYINRQPMTIDVSFFSFSPFSGLCLP